MHSRCSLLKWSIYYWYSYYVVLHCQQGAKHTGEKEGQTNGRGHSIISNQYVTGTKFIDNWVPEGMIQCHKQYRWSSINVQPRFTTIYQDCHLHQQHMQDQFWRALESASKTIGTHNKLNCAETVCCHLRSFNLSYWCHPGVPISHVVIDGHICSGLKTIRAGDFSSGGL